MILDLNHTITEVVIINNRRKNLKALDKPAEHIKILIKLEILRQEEYNEDKSTGAEQHTILLRENHFATTKTMSALESAFSIASLLFFFFLV